MKSNSNDSVIMLVSLTLKFSLFVWIEQECQPKWFRQRRTYISVKNL